MAIPDKNLLDQIGQVLKKSRGEPSTLIELIVCIRELNQAGKTASCHKVIRKLWPGEWNQAKDKITFEKIKWDLLCKRRRKINDRVFKSDLCFDFFIELTQDKQFVLISDPEAIHGKRADELERNLAKATSEGLKERIKASLLKLEDRYKDYQKSKRQARSAARKWAGSGLLAVLAVIVVLLVGWQLDFFAAPAREGPNGNRLPDGKHPYGRSIAVLPFENRTGDPDQAYFSDGMTEEVITALSNLPWIQVIDRNTAFGYKGKAVDGQELRQTTGARYVLQGSLRKTADRLRVTAQLSDTATGRHLWAERWDRDVDDVFTVQDELTMKIVTELAVLLQSGEHARLFARSTQNLEAFIKVIVAYHFFFEGGLDDTLRSRQMCDEAVALDPAYVAAYALLADTYLKEVQQGGGRPRAELVDKAFQTIRKALALDGSDALVHNILSRVYTFQDHLDLALAEAVKAVDIAPNSVECTNWQGSVLMKLGRPAEAIRLFNRSLDLNPRDPSLSLIFLGMAYTQLNQYEAAIPCFEKFLLLKPKSVMESLYLAAAYTAVGRAEDAGTLVRKALSKDPTLTVDKVLRRLALENESSQFRQWLADQLSRAGLP